MSREASSSSSLSLEAVGWQAKNPRLPFEIVDICQSRILPESEALDEGTELTPQIVLETRIRVARLVLEVLCLDGDDTTTITSPKSDVFGGPRMEPTSEGTKKLVKWATNLICQWYRAGSGSPWKHVLEKTLQQTISGDWHPLVLILSALLKTIPTDLRKAIFLSIVPALNEKLVQIPPPYPFPPLSAFLTQLSKTLPPVFFRPLFACATSDKEVVVINHLCTVQVHSRYIADYWVRDVEMLCMALLGNASGGETPGSREVARLGQLVLLVELIGRMQKIRHGKDPLANGDGRSGELLRFVTMLESRIWLMIEAKERTAVLPSSTRMLLGILFREFRLLTRSLKPAPWLTRTLRWFEDFIADEYIGEFEEEVTTAVERIRGLYAAAQAASKQDRDRPTSLLAATASKFANNSTSGKTLDLASTFSENEKLLKSLGKGYSPKAMKLFVALSALIAEEEYLNLGPLLWQHCLLDNVDASSTASACFLLMQCAEKTPIDLKAIIEVDLQTSDDTTRLEAVRKIGILTNWRFQIITQNFVTDRSHRPFKLARPPLPFIAADMGTSLYVYTEDSDESKESDDVPLELRQRLAELGFAEEDAGVIDPSQEWIKTPMSILPANQLDRMEVGINDPAFGIPTSPISSPQPSPRKLGMQRDQAQGLLPVEDAAALLRRNSSTGGPLSSVKRRVVFVPQLALIFPRLATLLFDKNVAVAAATRATLMDLMRNDPSLLLRPIYECLAGDNKDMQLAISTLTKLLHVRRTLPPPFTHSVFNNLAGLLKLLARNSEIMDSLHDFSLVLPVMAGIATQVSGMSIKEIRRSKLEHFIIPSGSLWFTSSAPKGSMFPRHLKPTSDPFEPVPPTLMEITMIRVSQNIFFYSMLKRNYQDVQVVRKNMSRLVLPSLDDYGLVKNLEMNDYMPRKNPPTSNRPPNHSTVEILSLMVSRSYLLLVAQIFRSMPRHLSDRHELATLVDGLNRALVVHGDDINIVSQVLIGYMVASTRFRRLFTSGGGYSLFMPALVKVYTEKPSHPGIRSAIEYAINRFYALHKDSFLYQAINTTGQLAMLPDIDLEWFSKGVYDLFASLSKGSSTTVDAAGIRNVNKAEEREALIIHTADEKPQTFLAAIRRGESQTSRQMSLQLPDEYESYRLSMDDFVRLFLTVIAHDLSIARAQHFLRLLRILSPHLYNASASTRTVLADGVVALGSILTRVFSKPKGGENMPKPILEEQDGLLLSPGLSSENNAKEKARTPSDSKIMRLDYLRLVLGLGSAGGQITLTVARHTLDVTRSLLKDWDTNTDALATFLGDFVKMLLYREEPTAPKAVVSFLQELSPILHAYLVSVNFTSVFETVLKLTEMSLYANDSMFGEVVVSEIVTAGLAACDVAASENQLMTLQYRPVLISLIAEAIFLKDADVFSEIEKRPPTYQFLAGVVLPLALSMKTEPEVITDGSRTDEHREKLAIAWVRILYYAIKACQRSRRDAESVNRGLGSSFRSKMGDKNRQEAFWRSHLPTFMTALQVIKVVVVRGAADISYLPRIGIWERLSSFCSSMFAEGNADFAFKPDINSAAATPTGSPRTSAQFDLSSSGSRLFVSTSSDLSRPTSPSSFSERTRLFRRPRIVDYSLWSMLEFVCAYRSPLRMHLKVLMMEKVVNLDHKLQNQSSGTGNMSPYPTSPSSRRVSTSVFSKSRQRMSSLMVPSPESSPRLMPSPSNLMPSPSLLEIPSRRAGYQISPISPQDNSGLPKILHLGPASPSTFPPISSPMIGAGVSGAGAIRNTRISGDGGESSSATRTTKIKSLKLIHETYRRIRGVQTFMGYDLLLPMPGLAASNSESAAASGSTEKGEEDAALETWTKKQALSAIVKETKNLMEEFEEGFGIDDGSAIVADADTRTSYSST
ncbi:Protein unc-80-like protein [Psilocybe cubensis]|nr:Protein unc-80-like protein [Psilocybe cubensis]KAH9478690.1 Protein unc-80-like protein [Psilocybe cubensis]